MNVGDAIGHAIDNVSYNVGVKEDDTRRWKGWGKVARPFVSFNSSVN